MTRKWCDCFWLSQISASLWCTFLSHLYGDDDSNTCHIEWTLPF